MPKPDARQLATLDALKKLDPSLYIEWDEDTGTPSLIRGTLSLPSPPIGTQSMADAAQEAAYAFLRANKALYHMQAPDQELPRSRVVSDELGSTVHLFQLYRGVEVLDGELSIALDRRNRVTQVLGRYRPNLRLSAEPAVPAEQAIQIALANLDVADKALSPVTSRLLIVNTSSFPDVVAKLGKKNLLSWRVELLTWVYFVDARKGMIFFSYDNAQTVRQRETYYTTNCRTLPGTLWITEEGAVPGQPVDDIAWSAHRHAGLVYDYYFNNFGLDSFDGRGRKMVSTVHSGLNTGFTCDQNNAAFIPMLSQVVYGDGDGSRFGPFARAVDVVGHEFTHAVVYYAITWPNGSPRGLDYHDEPGALNESYADFFGNLIENKTDWLLGEDCYTPQIPNDALRDMADPARCGQPDHYSKYIKSGTQAYMVHMNSGIMNKCAYLMSEGGTHYGVTVRGMGREAAAKIWYRALKHHLQGASTFKEARQALLQSCQELFPADALKYATVQNACAAVGIGEPAPASPYIAVEPTSIDFGTVILGQSAQRTLTVRNSGNAELVISAIGSSHTAFSLIGDTAFQLAPGGSKTLTIQFLPTATGQQQANLTINSNDGGQPTVTVSLSGSGLGVPHIAVEPTSVDFGTVILGQSAQRTLTVRNSGSADLVISAMRSSNAAFSLIGDTAFQLAPGSSKTLAVQFLPTATGQQQASLTVYSNDADQPTATVSLSGSSVSGPAIATEPTILNFGSVVMGDSAQLPLTLRNVGGSRLLISDLSIDHPAFDIVNDPASELDPGASETVVIRFAPTTEGRMQATLSIASNDPRRPTLAIPLLGIGEPAPVEGPHVVLDVQQLNFGSVPVGQAAQLSVTVKNTGTDVLIVDHVYIDLPAYAVIGETAFSVEPAASHSVTIEYKPVAEGMHRGTLTFFSNDPQQPEASVALVGTSTRCFVATAAYGSPMQRNVRTLRNFRDQSLLRSHLGRSLVTLYYRWNGTAAGLIAHSKVSRTIARWMLQPLVTLAHLVTAPPARRRVEKPHRDISTPPRHRTR